MTYRSGVFSLLVCCISVYHHKQGYHDHLAFLYIFAFRLFTSTFFGNFIMDIQDLEHSVNFTFCILACV